MQTVISIHNYLEHVQAQIVDPAVDLTDKQFVKQRKSNATPKTSWLTISLVT